MPSAALRTRGSSPTSGNRRRPSTEPFCQDRIALSEARLECSADRFLVILRSGTCGAADKLSFLSIHSNPRPGIKWAGICPCSPLHRVPFGEDSLPFTVVGLGAESLRAFRQVTLGQGAPGLAWNRQTGLESGSRPLPGRSGPPAPKATSISTRFPFWSPQIAGPRPGR
jgi:hypothetical protein